MTENEVAILGKFRDLIVAYKMEGKKVALSFWDTCTFSVKSLPEYLPSNLPHGTGRVPSGRGDLSQ